MSIIARTFDRHSFFVYEINTYNQISMNNTYNEESLRDYLLKYAETKNNSFEDYDEELSEKQVSKNLQESGFDKTTADKYAWHVKNSQYIDEVQKYKDSVVHDFSEAEIIDSINIAVDMVPYMYPSDLYCYLDKETYKIKWKMEVYDKVSKIIEKYKQEKQKYSYTEWQIIDVIAILKKYSVDGKYDKQYHTLIKDNITYSDETKFNCAYSMLTSFNESVNKNFYYVSDSLKHIMNKTLKDYKINKHQNAGRRLEGNCILCIDAKTNELIERYTSIAEIIKYNPDDNFDKTSISKCLNGKLKSHKGYIFKYSD